MQRSRPISAIVVPQGAEHRAVLKGLKQGALSESPELIPTVIPIPMGPHSVQQYLQRRTDLHAPCNILLMGLGGGLSAELKIGAIALVERCFATWANTQDDPQGMMQAAVEGDRPLLDWLQSTLGNTAHRVTGVTSQHVIRCADEKRNLHHRFNASVVDMEGYSFLKFCEAEGIQGTVLRVVSDGYDHDLPDISTAISPDGALLPVPLTVGLMRQPVAGIRLIRGSMVALSVLSQVTKCLVSHDVQP